MEIVFQPKAIEDINFWKKSGNTKVQNKITALLQSIKETPFEGIGKPEALKHNLTGLWSRRINQIHRIIYEIQNEKINIHSLRDHY